MPMGVLNDDDFENEINSFTKFNSTVIDIVKGRNGVHEVPESLRKIIAEEAIQGTSAKELEQIFDVSQSSISAYKKGATSTATYNKPETELKSHTNQIKDLITGKAKSKLLSALEHITEDKLKDAPLGVLANVAKSMSGVVKDLEPEEVKEKENNGPSYVIYAPQFRDERSFDVIHVKE